MLMISFSDNTATILKTIQVITCGNEIKYFFQKKNDSSPKIENAIIICHT